MFWCQCNNVHYQVIVLFSFQRNGSRTSWCGIKTETRHLVPFIDLMVHNITFRVYLLKYFLRKCITVLVLFRVFLYRFNMLHVFLHVVYSVPICHFHVFNECLQAFIVPKMNSLLYSVLYRQREIAFYRI